MGEGRPRARQKERPERADAAPQLLREACIEGKDFLASFEKSQE